MLKRFATWTLDNDKNAHDNDTCPGRRGFLKLAAVTLGSLAAAPALAGFAKPKDRVISFYNTNTGETLRRVYWTPRDGYLRDVMKEISWALRDYRTDEVKSIDPILMDQLYTLQYLIDYRLPFHVISGYRSPSTNAMLCKTSRRVARHSYHIQGMAVDIRTPGRSVADLKRAAQSLEAGGVGYYPRANFIHLDTGPVRYWS